MALLLTFLLSAFVLTALFWGGGLFLQAWLYNVPASKLWMRAAASGAGIALFLTLWCAIDRRNPGKYGTLFEFSGYESQEVEAFTSVKKVGSREVKIPFRKRGGMRGSAAFEDARDDVATRQPWRRADADGVVVALEVKEKDRDEPTRFETRLDAAGRFPAEGARYTAPDGRYIDEGNLALIVKPRPGLAFWNILLNALHFGVWLAAIWLGLRFTFGHALGLAFVFWLTMTLVVLPVLFQQTRPAAPAPTPKAAALAT